MQLNIPQLPYRTSFKVLQALTWRLIQTLVLLPSALVAIFLTVGVIMGQEPVRGVVVGILDYAENNVRPASEGYVLSVPCSIPEISADPQPIRCDATKAVEVPINEVVDDTLNVLFKLYSVVVVLSFILLVFIYPGRKYLGLTAKS